MSRAFEMRLLTCLAAMVTLGTVAPVLAQCQRAKLTDVAGAAGDKFGWALTAQGQTVLVGVPFDDDQGSNSGSVFAYDTAVTETSPVQQILRPGGAVGDGFGWCVDFESSTVMVGVLGEIQLDVVELVPEGGFLRTAILSPWDGDWENFFGQSVSVNGDVLVVGAPNATSLAPGGAAYVFERDPDSRWQPKQKLTAGDAQLDDAFGEKVTVDGAVIVIGAPDDDDLGFATGSAYVFERDPNTGAWTEVSKLLPTEYGGGFVSFGDAVAVNGDAILIGAHQTNVPADSAGGAYVFVRGLSSGGSVSWNLSQMLSASDAAAFDRFGVTVDIDTNVALIGAERADADAVNSGAAYVFERDPNTGAWAEVAKLSALDGQANDEFGHSVALSGTTAVVGAWKDDDMGTDSGSAYIFDLTGGDCNANGWCDDVDIAGGTSQDANANGVPDECDCWGDLDASGSVDLADLSALLTNFGLPSGMQYADGDLDADADVDLADLSALLERYGVACP
ncbi:MAG: hypothetical protein HRF50_17865 [Phycisphaerae bacterium]|jgi:hypothetical protein